MTSDGALDSSAEEDKVTEAIDTHKAVSTQDQDQALRLGKNLEHLHTERKELQSTSQLALDVPSGDVVGGARKKSRTRRMQSAQSESAKETAGDQDQENSGQEALPPPRLDRRLLVQSIREQLKAQHAQRESSVVTRDKLRLEADTPTDRTRSLTPLASRPSAHKRYVSELMDEAYKWNGRPSSEPQTNEMLTWEELSKVDTLSEQIARDFFAKEWSSATETGQQRGINASESSAVGMKDGAEFCQRGVLAPTVHEIIDETEPSVKNFADYTQMNGADLLISGIADWPTEKERIDVEAGFLYYATNTEAPLQLKTGGRAPRYPDDEGLYVGRPPLVVPSNLRRMENRIIQQATLDAFKITALTEQPKAVAELIDARGDDETERIRSELLQAWFGEDGKLKLLPNPIRAVPNRYPRWDDQLNPKPSAFQTDFISPLSSEACKRFLSSSNGIHHPGQIKPNFTLPHRKPSGIGVLDDAHECLLEIGLETLTFDFHPLFSWEHLYAMNLRQVVTAYEAELARDQVNVCVQRIRSLKRALVQLMEKKQASENRASETSIALELDNRIRDYEGQISSLRQTRNQAEGTLRGLLASALRCWKRVKAVRKVAGCTNTPVRLKITREIVEETEERKEWDKELEEIVGELRCQHVKTNAKLQESYKIRLKEYKELKKKQIDALKRQRQRESGQALNPEEESRLAEFEREDARILAQGRVRRAPTPPPSFNESLERERVEIQMRQYRRLPGEPKISISLLETDVLTDESLLSKGEAKRRKDVASSMYFFKLYFNGKLVETAKPIPLSQDFKVRFSWKYPMQIRHPPEEIKAVLFEKGSFFFHQLAEFHIAPPRSERFDAVRDIRSTRATPAGRTIHSSTQCLRFYVPNEFPVKNVVADNVQDLITSSVGLSRSVALEALDGSGEKTTVLMISGHLVTTASWVPTNIVYNTPQDHKAEGNRVIRSDGHDGQPDPFFGQTVSQPIPCNIHTSSCITDLKIDPNDPAETGQISEDHLTEGTLTLPGVADDEHSVEDLLQSAGVFRLNPLLKEFQFCSDLDLDQSRRLKLLQLRQSGIPELQGLVVPASSKHIPLDILKEYESSRKRAESWYAKGMQTYELRHQQFLEQMRLQIQQRFQDAIKQKTLKQMVVEDEVPNIFFIFDLIKRIFQARRPLLPIHKHRRCIAPQSVAESGLAIYATIYGAYNLPTREVAPTQFTARTSAHSRVQPICAFAEIQFQNQACVTPTSEGSNPSWNTGLSLPITLPAGMTRLEAIDDPVIVNVYDEILLKTTLPGHSNQIVQRTERRLLGGIEIPLSTIYLNRKVDGRLTLSVPLVLQGYEMPESDRQSNKPCIHIFMTLQPALHPPEQLLTNFATIESNETLHLLSNWRGKLESCKSFRNRSFNPIVLNIDCREVMMTRYLAPLNPPPELLPSPQTKLSLEESRKRLARYVSLIPRVSDSVSFPGLTDIWCTSDKFLSMMCGDEEEHAVLLACYFLYLEHMKLSSPEEYGNVREETAVGMEHDSLPVYLCIGEAVPEGHAVYVLLRQEKAEKPNTGFGWYFWNPSSGESYSVNNLGGPMRSVHGLVSMHNVWANIQSKHQPWELDWDLNSKRAWLPLFPRKVHKKARTPQSEDTPSVGGLNTLQPSILNYTQLESHEVEEIRFELEAALRDSLMQWRKSEITRINYEFITDLMRILENLEKHSGQRYDGLTQVLDRMSSRYEVYGFPMNFPWMQTRAIVERVRSKGIHEVLGSSGSLEVGHRGDSALKHAGSSSLQFAIAVYVKAYKGPVLSIWVYLAALWRRTSAITSS